MVFPKSFRLKQYNNAYLPKRVFLLLFSVEYEFYTNEKTEYLSLYLKLPIILLLAFLHVFEKYWVFQEQCINLKNC